MNRPFVDPAVEYGLEIRLLGLRVLLAMGERRLSLAALGEQRLLDPLGTDLLRLVGWKPDGTERDEEDWLGWAREQIRAVEDELRTARERESWEGGQTPLTRLCDVFDLSSLERGVVMMGLAPLIEPTFLAVFAAALGEGIGEGPTLGLAAEVIPTTLAERSSLWASLLEGGKLVSEGLLQLGEGRRVVAPERMRFTLTPRLHRFLLGDMSPDPGVRQVAVLLPGRHGLDGVVLPDELVAHAFNALNDYRRVSLALEGPEGTGRRTLATALAGQLGKDLLVVDLGVVQETGVPLAQILDRLSFDCRLMGWIPALLLPPGVAMDGQDEANRSNAGVQRVLRSALNRFVVQWQGMCCLISESRVLPCLLPGAPPWIRLTVSRPSPEARSALWKIYLPSGKRPGDAVIKRVAERFALTGAEIRIAAEEALIVLNREGRRRCREQDLQRAAGDTLQATVSQFGVRARTTLGWDDLVLEEQTLDALEEVVGYVRQRRVLLDEWGFGKKLVRGRGTTILFSGSPGTGKTCTAEVLATELGLDLFRINVSRIVDKYVGETEKHINRLFEMTREQQLGLLFDEADALFGSRVDVQSAVDRYANLQTNLLLQRIEEAEGVIILTTNLDKGIDEAFLRRIAFHIRFPDPDLDAREALWKTLLPAEVPTVSKIRYRDLAREFELAGGHIRNAILKAAARCADEGRKLSTDALKQAAQEEYEALGKLVRV